MRLATWNMQQAFSKKDSPRNPSNRWRWLEERVAPDVAVLTEAKPLATGLPAGWHGEWVPDGIGPNRRWGTMVVGHGVDIRPVTSVAIGRFRRRRIELTTRLPGAAVVADVNVRGERWATVVGLYGLTVNLEGERCGHGGYTIPALVDDLASLFESDRRDRLIVAGDFNLCPADSHLSGLPADLIDLASITSDDRPALDGCTRCDAATTADCGHLWTHRNGTSPNAAVQNIDYIFATEALIKELDSVTGGVADYPEVWEISDHAPVVADFFE